MVRNALNALQTVIGDRGAEALAPGELIAVNEAFGLLRRRVDAAYVPVAAEIARQSRREFGRDSLAKKQGFGTPAKLISATTGSSVGEAMRLVAVGEATAPRRNLAGEVLPAKHPRVAAALGEGRLGVSAASAIIGMLERVEPSAGAEDLVAMEARLVEAAPGLTPTQLNTLLLRGEALLDPDGARPREDERRADRSLVVRHECSGMVSLTGRFDPETAAPITAAIDGLVSGMLRRQSGEARSGGQVNGDAAMGAPDTGAVGTGAGASAMEEEHTAHVKDASTQIAVLDVADERSVRQMRADALSELCRHALGCEESPSGVTTTVVVRVSLNDLQAGVGCGTIDGIAHPVSAATVRRMAADAHVIPCVLGGNSEILDWGRAKRLFTPAQRLALAERDGGCAFCGAPPATTAAHHIRWWARDAGPTDLSNGVLLCIGCHHRVHDDGWEISVDGAGTTATVWFVPPPWIDPARRPRAGGRARYDLTA